MSKPEEKIIAILQREHISFFREYRFSDLAKYRFDFYIPSLNVVIEYDGEQHFQRVKKFQKTRGDFLRQQARDRKKNEFCLRRAIKLYRVPYWEIDNISCFKDLCRPKFRVKDKYHNDKLRRQLIDKKQ